MPQQILLAPSLTQGGTPTERERERDEVAYKPVTAVAELQYQVLTSHLMASSSTELETATQKKKAKSKTLNPNLQYQILDSDLVALSSTRVGEGRSGGPERVERSAVFSPVDSTQYGKKCE